MLLVCVALLESHELVINWKLPEDDDAGLDGAHLYLDYYATYSNDGKSKT